MSEDGGRPVRGYRPSRYGLTEDDCDEAELVRLANIQLYAERVSAGLPIFEDNILPAHPVTPGEHLS